MDARMRPRLVVARFFGCVAVAALAGAGCSGRGDKKFYRVPSSGMEPTIHCAKPVPECERNANDRVVVKTSIDEFRRGDIAVFTTPQTAFEMCGARGVFVKRVIGLPGETVEERSGGLIYVDGKKLGEQY